MSDIAINPVTRRVQFTGNTGTGPFAFTFNILIDSDIAVYKGTVLLTLTTDYTVSINANGTGSITLTAALVASDVLTIIGGRELSRTTDFVTAGDLLASSLNEQLDSNVIMTQQLDEKLGRGLFVNPGDVFTDLELPLKDDRKGTVLGFNETTGDPEPGPTLSDVDSLATISADIKTLAEIQDGTVATDAITNVNTIRTDVTTVSGISSNVTTVAGNTSNINTVAGNNANITTVAGINSDVTTVSGISSDVTTVAADGADIGVVAGLSSDITTVSGISTEIGRLGTADAVSDMNALSPAAVIADMDSLADNVSAISIVSDDIGYVIAVAINAANINTVAADGADIGTVAGDISNVNTVATNITSVNTNATNITDIQNASANAATATTQAGIATTQAGIATTKASEASASEVAAEAAKVAAEAALDEFTDIYLGAKASDPTTDNDGNALTAGDQYFNTTINVLKIYNGSAWQAAAIDSSGFVETTGDTMTGNLSFGDNDKAIFGAGSDLQIYHTGTYSLIADTSGTGPLRVVTNQFQLNNAADTANLFKAIEGGAVTAYYDGSEKLATTSTGIDVTGNATFADNGKAIFGAGSDLQIYHDGSNSRIQDTATGSLILAGTNFYVNNTGDSKSYLAGLDGGSTPYVRLYYDGATRLDTTSTGVDITGTLTSDGLTVDGTSAIELVSDKTVTTPHTDYNLLLDNGSDTEFVIRLDSVNSGSIGSSHIKQISEGANRGALVFATENGSGGTVPDRLKIDYNGDISFYEDTGTTPKFFWDASGESLTLNSTLKVEGGTTNGFLQASGSLFQLGASTASDLVVYTTNTEQMRITSSGNVGIGTSSPYKSLTVGETDATAWITSGGSNVHLTVSPNGASGSFIVRTGGTNGDPSTTTERMRIDSSGRVGIGTSPDFPLHVSSTGVVLGLNATSGAVSQRFNENGTARFFLSTLNGSNGLAFVNGDGTSERMRIDSSGNLLVGKTSQNIGTVGFEATPSNSFQANASTANGKATHTFNRLTSDGDIATFRKDGSTVGSIGTNSNTTYIDGSAANTGLQFAGSTIAPRDSGALSDASVDLGAGSYRFKDLYLSGGVYLGGTGAANKLDDYEEGTFTPTAFGNSTAGTTTYASQTGSYTKVGDTVHVNIYISWTAMTGTGDLRIGGLPFTSSSASNYFSTGTIVPLLGFTWPSGKTQLNPIISASDTAMSIYGSATDSNSDGAATDSEIVALAITITYKV